ncbi:MAG: EutN/CcmL family microcompartment protein [Planctomycetes bacterium]|nr:EutN/CcmL family microcompartment protein [Planctomycetota bacterium]
MLLGVVEGNVVTTIRHRSLKGWRLLIVQPLGANGKADGDPVLAIDSLGAGIGSRVLISNDGKGTREMVGDNNSPLRWSIVGIDDHGE